MLKERLLHFTGFDRFERKYIFYFIPFSVIVPMFLLLRNYRSSTHREGSFQFSFRVAGRFLAYVIPYIICLNVIGFILSGTAETVLSFVLFSVFNFFLSVSWMGLAADYIE